MNIKNAFHFCLLVGCLLVEAHPQEAKVETFWVGRTLEGIKERPIKSSRAKGKDGKPYHCCLKDGFMMAGLRPLPVLGVLVRGKTCYVFDIGNWPDKVRNLPLRHGDKLFYYRDRTELEALKIPIFEKDEAVTRVLKGANSEVHSYSYKEGMPYLLCEVDIVGAGKTLLMVDTAASVTVLDSTFARKIGLNVKVGEALVNSDSSNPSDIDFFQAPEMRLGEMSLSGITRVGVLDLSRLKRLTGFDIRGVLGLDALSDKILEVNMDKGEMRIYRSADPLTTFPQSTFVRRSTGGVRVLDIKLAETSLAFMLDTGSTSCIELKASHFDKLVAEKWVKPGASPSYIYLQSGLTRVLSGAFMDGEVLGLPLVSKEVVGGEVNMLCLGFLNYFHFAIDFPNSRLHYSPRPDFKGVFSTGMQIGASFHYLEDDRVVIAGVVKDRSTPTSNLHLQEGDEVLQFGVFKANQLNSEVVYQVCKEFAEEKVRFKVVRNQRVIFDGEIKLPALPNP